MSADPHYPGPLQTVGLVLFTFALIFCSREVVPAWSSFQLDWPPGAFYALMALLGTVAGGLFGKNYWLPGAFGGMLAGLGALAAMAFVLERTTYTNNYVFVIVAGIGSLPGVGVGFGLKALQDVFFPPYTPSFRDEDALPRRRRSREEEDDEEAPPRSRLRDDEGHIRPRRPRDESGRD
jgi:hypothetical protein